MKKGLVLSLILHGLFLLMILVGVPDLFRKELDTERVLTVEILPISSMTNVKPEVKQAEKKPEPPKPVEKPPEPKKEEPKEEVKEKPVEKPIEKPPEPEKEIIPDEKKKPAEKKKEEVKKPEKKVSKDNDFDSVLKTVKKVQQKNDFEDLTKAFEKVSDKNVKSTNYDPTKKLSMSEMDSIKQQISKCWTIPAGARDIQDMQVLIRVSLAQDGKVVGTKIVDQMKYSTGNEFYRVAVDSAVRAVLKCSPLKGLPVESYNNWKEIEINFDPKEMIY